MILDLSIDRNQMKACVLLHISVMEAKIMGKTRLVTGKTFFRRTLGRQEFGSRTANPCCHNARRALK